MTHTFYLAPETRPPLSPPLSPPVVTSIDGDFWLFDLCLVAFIIYFAQANKHCRFWQTVKDAFQFDFPQLLRETL